MVLAFIFFFLLFPALASAEVEVAPLFTRNQGPLVQIFGLPPAEGGTLAGTGRTTARLVLDAANIFTGGENDHEELRLDGETYRLTLAVRHGFSEGMEIGIDLPYVWHTGGKLDGVINGFHRAFDLPEGGRDQWYDDRLRYLSKHEGNDRLRIDEPQDGIGDVVVTAGFELLRKEDRGGVFTLSLRPALKLPTGSGSRLTGSGSTDFSLRLAATDGLSLAPWRLTWYGAVGGLAMTEGDVLADLQQDLVAFGTLGIGWTPVSWLALKVQLDGHTPFYKGSDLRQLDDPSVQIVFGTAFPLPGEAFCDFAVTEDLFVETAPDVVFHLAVWKRF